MDLVAQFCAPINQKGFIVALCLSVLGISECRCIWRLSDLRPDKFPVSFTPRRSLHAQDIHPGCK
jgi:hypothetical protein